MAQDGTILLCCPLKDEVGKNWKQGLLEKKFLMFIHYTMVHVIMVVSNANSVFNVLNRGFNSIDSNSCDATLFSVPVTMSP